MLIQLRNAWLALYPFCSMKYLSDGIRVVDVLCRLDLVDGEGNDDETRLKPSVDPFHSAIGWESLPTSQKTDLFKRH
jgi:hypothetical protein